MERVSEKKENGGYFCKKNKKTQIKKNLEHEGVPRYLRYS